MTVESESYRSTLADLYARANAGIKLGLETMQALLDALGNPERRVRHIVVAGTNGKGSTSAMLAAALQASGHRVGLYTSPHLLRFTERIRIDGQELDRRAAVSLYERICAAESRAPRQPTFFECVTAMALLAFAEARVDVAVLEVGLGGRLDATNVVDKLLSIITPVDFDHQELLGDSLAAIAAEKADIIAPDGCVIVAPQAPEAMTVIEAVARDRRTKLVLVQEAERVGSGALQLRGSSHPTPLVVARVPAGDYQRQNLATVAAACVELSQRGLHCALDAGVEAAAQLQWIGRFHWIPTSPPVLLDGAHNPAGISALLAALEADERTRGRRVHAVFTALRTKNASPMVAALGARCTSLSLCPTSSRRTRSLPELLELAREARAAAGLALPVSRRDESHATVHATINQALAMARSRAAQDNGVVLVTGSLFLVADALAELLGWERDPAVDG